MRVGINIGGANTHEPAVGERLAHMAEQADQAGFSTLMVPDHFTLRPESVPFMPREGNGPIPAVMDFFEAWSTLAFVAARTSQIKLSTLVSGITMRYPAMLVKLADTLDALSNGRAYLGIGAGPNFGEDEHQRMGFPFPSAGERIARLEEVLRMALQLWSGEDKPFEGKYYQLTSTIGNPFFVQKPHPPIMIAGNGNKMLRVMAQYADAINIGFGGGLDDLREKLAKLREHCETLNRSYEHIKKTTFFVVPMIRDGHLDPAILEQIAVLGELGFEEIIIRYPSDPAMFEIIVTELLPAVAKLPVAGA